MYIFRSKWPANADIFPVFANPEPKSNYFSSGETAHSVEEIVTVIKMHIKSRIWSCLDE